MWGRGFFWERLVKTLCLALFTGLFLAPGANARELEIGLWSPVWATFNDSAKTQSLTGGGITVILSSSFGLGLDSVGANFVPTDASSDSPQLKHTLFNFSFTMPRKEALDITLGFGLGTVSYSCDTCSTNYESGKSSQIFLEGRGNLWGLEWAMGLRKVSGLIKGVVLGAGNKVADKNAGFTAASFGVGVGFK